MDVSEVKVVEMNVIRSLVLGLFLVALFVAGMTYVLECEKCNCYTIPVLNEWITDKEFTGKTVDYAIMCPRCSQKILSSQHRSEKKQDQRKW